MQTEQPLTSVAAFALALVEASSRLTETAGVSEIGVGTVGETETLPVACADALAAAD